MGKIPRIYADTSVYGGVFDAEFAKASEQMFNLVRVGALRLVTSVIVEQEISVAPKAVRDLFEEIAQDTEVADVTADVIALRQAYIDAGVVVPRWSTDTMHVAVATAARCDAIVSWNLKHIVHIRRIPMYHAVNARLGFDRLEINSPLAVVGDERDETDEEET